MMCKYCEQEKGCDGNELISERELASDGLTYEGIEMQIENGNELRIFAVGESCRHCGTYGSYDKTILINYCPMCGKDLECE